MDVSVPLSGKEAACKDETIIPLLVHLLSDIEDEVKTNAAGALMTIAITTQGILDFFGKKTYDTKPHL